MKSSKSEGWSQEEVRTDKKKAANASACQSKFQNQLSTGDARCRSTTLPAHSRTSPGTFNPRRGRKEAEDLASREGVGNGMRFCPLRVPPHRPVIEGGSRCPSPSSWSEPGASILHSKCPGRAVQAIVTTELRYGMKVQTFLHTRDQPRTDHFAALLHGGSGTECSGSKRRNSRMVMDA